ncbi:11042_t:CDS:2, partial [Gigaspora margarita]
DVNERLPDILHLWECLLFVINHREGNKLSETLIELIIPTEAEPAESAPSRKLILELLECGTTNYSTNEIQNQFKDKDTIEVLFNPSNNPVVEINSKEENIYSSIWAPKAK